MESKREQAMVGIFVLIAGAVLVGTIFALTGAFGGSATTYRAYFPFAGGLEPGATVRYAGGPKVGRVEKLQLDSKDSSRIEITFSVKSGLPVKTDSRVKIMSLSPLGDNHLEIVPGSEKAALAATGAILPSDPYVDFNALTAKINEIAPQAQQLLKTLNDRATELKVTVDRVNDLINPRNRANLAGTLAETRAQVKTTVQNLNSASQNLSPLLQDLRKTAAQANEALNHVDSLIGENRADVRQAVVDLRRSLATVTDLTARLDQTLDVNSENIDELLENLRHVSENLKQFTNTIKTRPYTLIRSSNPREHKPGERQ